MHLTHVGCGCALSASSCLFHIPSLLGTELARGPCIRYRPSSDLVSDAGFGNCVCRVERGDWQVKERNGDLMPTMHCRVPELRTNSMVVRAGLWETWGMSEKRTKSDNLQRQADKLEKKARRPGAKKKKRPSRKSTPETNQSKMARIENSPSQRRRERNEREDFSKAAAPDRERGYDETRWR